MESLVNELTVALSELTENLIVLDEMDSTHSLSLRLMEQMEDEGLGLATTVFVARRQSHGRGRGERRWSSPEGGLYLSWIRSGLSAEVVARLPMVAAAAAVTAVEGLGIDTVDLKWPNDLLIQGAKLGGLLVHARQGDSLWATVGFGINLTGTPEISDDGLHPPTSLRDHLPDMEWGRHTALICQGYLRGLQRAVDEPEEALATWRAHLVHQLGDRMTIRLGAGQVETGTYAGLTPEGYLRLDCGSEIKVIGSGDVIDR